MSEMTTTTSAAAAADGAASGACGDTPAAEARLPLASLSEALTAALACAGTDDGPPMLTGVTVGPHGHGRTAATVDATDSFGAIRIRMPAAEWATPGRMVLAPQAVDAVAAMARRHAGDPLAVAALTAPAPRMIPGSVGLPSGGLHRWESPERLTVGALACECCPGLEPQPLLLLTAHDPPDVPRVVAAPPGGDRWTIPAASVASLAAQLPAGVRRRARSGRGGRGGHATVRISRAATTLGTRRVAVHALSASAEAAEDEARIAATHAEEARTAGDAETAEAHACAAERARRRVVRSAAAADAGRGPDRAAETITHAAQLAALLDAAALTRSDLRVRLPDAPGGPLHMWADDAGMRVLEGALMTRRP